MDHCIMKTVEPKIQARENRWMSILSYKEISGRAKNSHGWFGEQSKNPMLMSFYCNYSDIFFHIKKKNKKPFAMGDAIV